MRPQHADGWSRRAFLAGLPLTGTAGLLGVWPTSVAAEPPPETATLRLIKIAGICIAPQYVAQELLEGEGFAGVVYVEATPGAGVAKALAAGEAHLSLNFVAPFILRVDAGDPIVMLAGGHVGCFELFGTERSRAIHDLKGRTVAVQALGSSQHVFLASMASYVGLGPRQDITWVTQPSAEAIQRLAEGTVDAFLGLPPDPQELQARQIGHLVVDSAVDRPWSQYFCCIVAGNRAFVQKFPVATKRAVRAILKAPDVCALEPERAAQLLVTKGYVPRYEYALQTMRQVPYNKGREYEPEDTVRFYALRLHEAGMVKRTPQQILAQGTGWRVLQELKRELKG